MGNGGRGGEHFVENTWRHFKFPVRNTREKVKIPATNGSPHLSEQSKNFTRGKIVRFRFSVTKHPSYLFVSAGKLKRVHLFMQGKKGCVCSGCEIWVSSAQGTERKAYEQRQFPAKNAGQKMRKEKFIFRRVFPSFFLLPPLLKKALVLTQHIASRGNPSAWPDISGKTQPLLRRFPQEKEKENALKKAPPFVSFSRLRRR